MERSHCRGAAEAGEMVKVKRPGTEHLRQGDLFHSGACGV